MKLSRTVSYALRATMLLAQQEPGKPIPCSHLAKQGEMPERFLLQILRNLVNQGLLRSTRGVEGGYTLAHPASDLSVLNIIEAVEGPLRHEAQVTSDLPEPALEARLDVALRDVSTTLRNQLDAIKIAHLLRPPANEGVSSN